MQSFGTEVVKQDEIGKGWKRMTCVFHKMNEFWESNVKQKDCA